MDPEIPQNWFTEVALRVLTEFEIIELRGLGNAVVGWMVFDSKFSALI
jgi:hypothetical protein